MKRNTFSKDTRYTPDNERDFSLPACVIYCRVSTDDQSCERQERDLRAFATRKGYDVVAVFRETASGTKNDRKLRAEVLALAQAKHIEAVLVTELTRWGRSTTDLIDTLQQLYAKNVSLLCQTGMDFDLSTPQGKLMLTMMAGFAQFERDLIGERTKSGLAAAVARGQKLGRPTGNRTDDAHRVAVLDLHNSGFSIRAISSKLRISKDTVSRIIKLV